MALVAMFAVYLTGDVEVPASRISEHYGESDHYKMSDRVYMVRADDLAQSVANKLGLDGSTPGATGVVWKLNAAYGGIEKRELWEWLELAQQRRARPITSPRPVGLRSRRPRTTGSGCATTSSR